MRMVPFALSILLLAALSGCESQGFRERRHGIIRRVPKGWTVWVEDLKTYKHRAD